MGLDNHAALSPAHRRNQNPASPSASFFRRSSTFSREEPDLSWVALLRRHRFLLLMLAVLAFLCTVYLYFAIKLGADNCSGLTGKDEALCRLKESKIKPSHVQRSRRMLLNVQELAFEPNLQNYAHEGNERSFLRQSFLKVLSSFWCKEAFGLQWLCDLRLSEKCTLLKWINDESIFAKLGRLLKDEDNFLWILDTRTSMNTALSLDKLKLHSWLGLVNKSCRNKAAVFQIASSH